ncbi:response regulator receiver protein [Chthoniobacter flavus Ellin428]|uniref:Response regulator receiver protein n=1 Tax=Chthoniobacter flavus Ellin428 TaxID=497964 RepID=B4D880_9BACT|nr:response regulator [Chthoniobacter flavus]EDY17273.1 response regulator receiver protein [Chthoniobacter flavus Ellin428]
MSAPAFTQVPGGCGELEYKHVLLVDDNQLLASRIRSTLKFLVKSHEFVVTTVANGADAIRAIMAFDFDLIICDMTMPFMAGDMFYLAVQRVKPQMVPRLLFVTDPEATEINTYIQSIKGQIVYKPVEADELERAIRILLARRKRPPGSLDIDLDRWRDIPCLTDRIADEDDVRAGRAIFCIRPLDNLSVSYEEIGLPHCAIFTDECEQHFPVVIVQSERSGHFHYVGFRFLERGNGIGYRSELELLDEPNELFYGSREPELAGANLGLCLCDTVQILPAPYDERISHAREELAG